MYASDTKKIKRYFPILVWDDTKRYGSAGRNSLITEIFLGQQDGGQALAELFGVGAGQFPAPLHFSSCTPTFYKSQN